MFQGVHFSIAVWSSCPGCLMLARYVCPESARSLYARDRRSARPARSLQIVASLMFHTQLEMQLLASTALPPNALFKWRAADVPAKLGKCPTQKNQIRAWAQLRDQRPASDWSRRCGWSRCGLGRRGPGEGRERRGIRRHAHHLSEPPRHKHGILISSLISLGLRIFSMNPLIAFRCFPFATGAQ
jgi:hypothetical protein